MKSSSKSVLIILLVGNAADAATITVDTVADESQKNNECSLRQAVNSANNNTVVDSCQAGEAPPVVDEIVFDASINDTAIKLQNGSIDISESVVVKGNGINQVDTADFDSGDAKTVIASDGGSRLFEISVSDAANTVRFEKLALVKGAGSERGGAIESMGVFDLTLRDVIVADNVASANTHGFGGAVYVSSGGLLNVENSLFLNNEIDAGTTASGGAIYVTSSGVLDIYASAFFGNSAQSAGKVFGGAVAGRADLSIANSVFDSNSAVDTVDSSEDTDDRANGGALSLQDGVLEISDSTFVNNVASAKDQVTTGGAIRLYSPPDGGIVRNSTFSGNIAEVTGSSFGVAQGGAIGMTGDDHHLELNNVTVTLNEVDGQSSANGGGLFTLDLDGGSPVFFITGNTLIAGNTATGGGTLIPDCAADIQSAGHTLLGDNTFCNITPASGDHIGDVAGGGSAIDSNLDPLADNGGGPSVDGHTIAMLTHLPASGDLPVDEGDPGGSCVSQDQRGVPRPQDGDNDASAVCDIGALEYELPDFDGDGDPDVTDPDDDDDGMSDTFENEYGLDPFDASDATEDPDNDGLDNLEEFNNNQSDPNEPDTDFDGIGDSFDDDPHVGSNVCDEDIDGNAVFDVNVSANTTEQCAASSSIEVMPAASIDENGGRAELIAPNVEIAGGFFVPEGAELNVKSANPTPP